MASRRSRTTLRLPKCRTWIVWPGAYKDSHKQQANCDRTQQERKGDQDRETAQVVRRSSRSRSTFGKGFLNEIWVSHTEYPQVTSDQVRISTRSPPSPTTVKLGIDMSPPRRVQPALPTGTQGEEGIKDGNGVPPPIVGRLGTSGKAGSHQKFCEPRSTIVVPRFRALCFLRLNCLPVGGSVCTLPGGLEPTPSVNVLGFGAVALKLYTITGVFVRCSM